MNKNRPSTADKIQNTLIAILIVFGVFLLIQTQRDGGFGSGEMFDDFFNLAAQTQAESDAGAIQNAVIPLHIIARNGDETYGYLNTLSSDTKFESSGALLKEALGSSGQARKINQTEFQSALQKNSICFYFFDTLPLSVLSHWLEIEGTNSSYTAQIFVISYDSDDYATLYTGNPQDNSFYAWTTAVSVSALSSAVTTAAGKSLTFAFASDAYAALNPYTVLPGSLASMPVLSATDSLAAMDDSSILTALGFNAHTNSRYTESNGTEVIVESTKTLRIARGNTLLYTGDADAGDPFSIVSADGETTMLDAINTAWKIADSILSQSQNSAKFYLKSATEIQDGYLVKFGYMINGYPISCGDTGDAITFTITDNTVTSFELYFRGYTQSDTSSALLPIKQTVAAAPKNALLSVGYYDGGSDTVLPAWLID